MQGSKSPTRHYCDHVDCGKSFRRAEHLTRHKLNHTNSTIQCPRCDRLFYRRDLLHRHLTLKHGEPSRANRMAEGSSPAPLTGGPAQTTIADSNTHAISQGDSPGLPAPNFQFPSPTFNTGLPSNGLPGNGSALATQVPFSFASPSLEFTQGWDWLHQGSLTDLAPDAELLGVPGSKSPDGMTGLNEDWMSSTSSQDIYTSQEIVDFIAAVPIVAESIHRFGHLQITSMLTSGCLYLSKALPIFHLPTFNLDLVRRELCVAVFSTGLLIADDDEIHRIGCNLLGQTRSQLLQYIDANTIYLSDIGLLQALLIIEFAGMYLADRPAMELSDIFHGTLVTLCRRLGLFDSSAVELRASTSMAENTDWNSRIERECTKRLAYFVFAHDIEQVLFFGHERSILSFYSMKLTLPSNGGDVDDIIGESPNRRPTSEGRLKFHVLCHALLSKDEPQLSILGHLSPFSLVAVLLGLTSVAMNILRRKQDPFMDTKLALTRLGSVLPAVYGRLIACPDGSMKRRGQVIYHMTIIALSTPMEDLEKAANDGFSRHGRTPKQQARAAIIRLLTRQKVGSDPARHAVELLRLYLTIPNQQSNATDRPAIGQLKAIPFVPYETSALYLACLTLWAFVMGRAEETDDLDSQFNNDIHLSEGDFSNQEVSSTASIATLLDGMATAIDRDNHAMCQSHWRSIIKVASAKLASNRNSNAQEYSQVLTLLADG